MAFQHLFIGTLLVCVSAQYGPDPPHVPDDFKCAWRQLIHSESIKLRPDADSLVADALELPKYCQWEIRGAPSAMYADGRLGGDHAEAAIYVDGSLGDDRAEGTEQDPVATVAEGVRRSRMSDTRRVVVRSGTYHLTEPLQLTSADSGLTIESYSDAEEVWLSGSVPLDGLEWRHEHDRVFSADVSRHGLDGGRIASLRVDGRRINPARYPNADPEVEFWPTGYLTSKEAYEPDGDWLSPKIAPDPNAAEIVNETGRPFDQYFSRYEGGIGGTCQIYDPPFSFWCQSPPFSKGCGGCFTWNVPGGLHAKALANRSGFPYARAQDAYLFAWRKAHWANWAFEVESLAPNGSIGFGRGGFQGARGGAGSDWFVANVLEELDRADEFYFDRAERRLYVVANETDAGAPPSAARRFEVIPAARHTLLNASGTQEEPLTGLTLRGIGFRDAAWTMMQPHGVPSAGDWALERMAAAHFEGTEGLLVANCSFFRLGGNALMLSKYHRNATVEHNDFAYLGGSAIAAWGWTDEISEGGRKGADGTAGIFPRYTLVRRNLFREIGVWEKQSSAFFQAKGAQTTAVENVAFNLGRAAFNFNDGFGGGDLIEGNVLFNTCRESSDHGPINSWDRQPFITTVRDGTPSAQMAWREVTRNLLVSNYGGAKGVDTDDGSLFWNIHHVRAFPLNVVPAQSTCIHVYALAASPYIRLQMGGTIRAYDLTQTDRT